MPTTIIASNPGENGGAATQEINVKSSTTSTTGGKVLIPGGTKSPSAVSRRTKKVPQKNPTVIKGPATLKKSYYSHDKSLANRKQQHSSKAAVSSQTYAGHFDITSLKPLRSKAGAKKKWVELYCKGSQQVLCCFRGHNDAAIALNLDRKVIRKMCEKQTPRGDFPIYATFSLMYASNKVQASAYHYGIHVEDFAHKEENHADRLKRFKRIYEVDKNRNKKMQQADPAPPTNEVPISSLQPISHAIDSGGIITIDGEPNSNLLVTVVENESALLNQGHQGICIFCQDKKACIVFNPCRHSVLCEECFLKGNCRKFCPVCRVPISSTVKSEKAKLVRPRVFSAYEVIGLGDI
jgi:hypothetical protein